LRGPRRGRAFPANRSAPVMTTPADKPYALRSTEKRHAVVVVFDLVDPVRSSGTFSAAGRAQIERDDARRRGIIEGAGRDLTGDSGAAGEAGYIVAAAEQDVTHVA
jgi:hypothetical protein